MMESLKKAALIGAGAALEVTDKLKEMSAGIETTLKSGKLGTINPEKVMTEMSAAWFYTYWPDELEEMLGKVVADVLHSLDIPTRKELEEVKARIAKLEARGDDKTDI
jgi:polyhydroxyalkanoate synthesis regulator phasin